MVLILVLGMTMCVTTSSPQLCLRTRPHIIILYNILFPVTQKRHTRLFRDLKLSKSTLAAHAEGPQCGSRWCLDKINYIPAPKHTPPWVFSKTLSILNRIQEIIGFARDLGTFQLHPVKYFARNTFLRIRRSHDIIIIYDLYLNI